MRNPIEAFNHIDFIRTDNQNVGFCNAPEVRELEAYTAELEEKLEIAVEELEVVAEWGNAYPEDTFPPIGTDTYHLICKASGISVDRVSAHVLRKIVKAYSEAAIKTLNQLKGESS